jgi:hypothetical protein
LTKKGKTIENSEIGKISPTVFLRTYKEHQKKKKILFEKSDGKENQPF